MIEGYVHPEFRGVATMFERQLPESLPGGGALTIYHRGAVVLDVWGGLRSPDRARWAPDTVSTSFSTSKGIVSTLLHLLADRGLVDYRLPVATYWPEFAQAGKDRISVRTLMSHEAGLYDVRGLVEHASELNEWDHMLELLERAQPVHRPGSRHGYHAWTYGYLVGGLIEKVTGKRLHDVLDAELVEPLGLDGAYLGLPESEHSRAATLVLPTREEATPTGTGIPPLAFAQKVTSLALRSQTRELRRALMPHGMRGFDLNGPEFRSACNPSAGGMFTARSLARIYAMLAEGGSLDGRRHLGPSTVEAMAVRQSVTPDAVLRLPMHWRLGYHRVFSLAPRAPHAFGHFGFGGSGAWADPSRRLSLGYTVNSGTGSAVGDLRIIMLTNAALRAADSRRG